MKVSVHAFLLIALVGCAGDSRERLQSLGASGGALRAFEAGTARVDLSPANRSRRAGAEQLLIASVYDKDGKPKPKARVEWTLEGPGRILAVDDGTFLRRGARVDPGFAYSYTASSKRSVAGERGDPRDDFDLQPGQTWCIVSSAEPGRTKVIAKADESTGTAELRWTDTDPSNPSRNTTPNAERTDAAQVSLDIRWPRAIGVNRESTAKIVLANGGRRDSQPLTVGATVPEGVEILRIDPPALRRNGNTLTWALERLGSGETQEYTLIVKPVLRGQYTLLATAETSDGLRAEQRAGASADDAGVKLALDAPATAATGTTLPVRITVTNLGAVPVANAVAWIDGPDETSKPVERTIGAVGANESKTVTANVPVTVAGRRTVRVTVTADGGLAERSEAGVQVGKSELELAVTGSDAIPVGQEGLFEFRATNRGDAPLGNVVVRASLPGPLTAKSASDGGRVSEGGASWSLGTLAAGESKVVRLGAAGTRMAESLEVAGTAEGELAGGQRVRTPEMRCRTSVAGRPVLTMQLTEPSGPVSVGGRAVFRITVRNRGNAAARDVAVSATATEQFRPTRGTGPEKITATVGASSVRFGTLAELAPGATAIYTVELDAITVGIARLHVEVASRELEKSIMEEQATAIERRR
jgi:hypothetical protein